MKYTVDISTEAQANILSAFNFIAESSPMNAAKWLQGLYKSIDTLEMFPRRCGEAREQAFSTQELRQMIYKSHRIIFTIDDARQVVSVIYVRHSKMRAIGEPTDDE
jgi:hypothetical protein